MSDGNGFAAVLSVIFIGGLGTLAVAMFNDASKESRKLDTQITAIFNERGYKTEAIGSRDYLHSGRDDHMEMIKTYTFSRNDSLFEVDGVMRDVGKTGYAQGTVVSQKFVGMKTKP